MQRYFPLLISVLIFLTFDLMLLGAGVRSMDAGLACPDWPLCFGKVIPDFHFGVWLEFLHRAVAGVVSVLFLGALVMSFVHASYKRFRWILLMAAFILLSQIIMGGLTVLKILDAGIVATHLSLATAFLLCLVYVSEKLREKNDRSETPKIYIYLSAATLVMVCVQIVLGGLVASNYAGMACVDFPTCNGQWFPAWTGPIGLQVMHRMGAYMLSLLVLSVFLFTLSLQAKGRVSKPLKRLSFQAFVLLLSQVAIGIMNIKMLIPAWLTVIHLGVGLFILLTMFRLNLRLWQSK